MGLRYHMDCRATDLEELAADLERQLIDVGARRANLLVHLRRVEESRQSALEALEVLPALSACPPQLVADITDTFTQGLDISTEITRLEARAEGIRVRLGEIGDEQSVLRKVSRELAQVPGQSTVDPDQRASRYSQAARQIYEIADIEHAETARLILEGPMQRLWDAALEAELIGRSIAREPATACRSQRALPDGCRRRLGAPRRGHRRTPAPEPGPGAGRRHPGAATRDGQNAAPILLHVLGSERRMPQLAEITMYRILEQAIDNALTHGRPQRVDTIISFLPRWSSRSSRTTATGSTSAPPTRASAAPTVSA